MIGRYRFRRLLLRNERFLLRLFQQLQFAMRQLIYAICHLRHFFIMGDEDDGLAFIRALPHQPPYDGLVLLIERCGDLIPKDDLPICGQRAEHSETLSFSAGEQTDTLLSFLNQPRHPQQFLCPIVRIIVPQIKLQIVQDRIMGKQ